MVEGSNNPPCFYSHIVPPRSQSGSRVNTGIIKTNSKAGLPRTPHYFALLTCPELGRTHNQSVIFHSNPPDPSDNILEFISTSIIQIASDFLFLSESGSWNLDFGSDFRGNGGRQKTSR